MNVVQIKRLTVNYSSKGTTIEAIRNLTLDISSGGIYSIIGPSGSGKSTLLHVLAGIIKDYEGEVLINNHKPDSVKQSIGLVPQNYGLLPWKSVEENIYLASKIKKKKVDSAFLEEIIETLELKDLLCRYPNELSGGQQQRVALARSFIQKPDLLLMDEPFSALDSLTAEKCRNLFLNVWKKHKVTTLFITHNIDEAVQIGKYIVLLSKSPGQVTSVIENPLMQPGAERNAETYFKEAQLIRSLIATEWV